MGNKDDSKYGHRFHFQMREETYEELRQKAFNERKDKSEIARKALRKELGLEK